MTIKKIDTKPMKAAVNTQDRLPPTASRLIGAIGKVLLDVVEAVNLLIEAENCRNREREFPKKS